MCFAIFGLCLVPHTSRTLRCVGAASAESLAAYGNTGAESICTRRIISDLEIFRWRTNPHIAKYVMCGAPGFIATTARTICTSSPAVATGGNPSWAYRNDAIDSQPSSNRRASSIALLSMDTWSCRVPHTFAFCANVWALRSDGTPADHDNSSLITRYVPIDMRWG